MTPSTPKSPLSLLHLMAVVAGFVLVGPLVGCCLLMTGMAAYGLVTKGLLGVLGLLLFTPVALMAAFYFGALPAGFTGLAYGLLRHRVRTGWPAALLAGGCGSGALLACYLAATLETGMQGIQLPAGESMWRMSGIVAFGAISALATRELLRTIWHFYQRRHQSFDHRD